MSPVRVGSGLCKAGMRGWATTTALAHATRSRGCSDNGIESVTKHSNVANDPQIQFLSMSSSVQE